ncbi:MAG: hypothetical protein BWY32_02383 [bacterium ADurb.Bin243]|nr:MAG: hypothetical protein BWY32_02383 [bacterium ADurb.Bin243]
MLIMNPNIINLIIFFFMLTMMFSAFNYFISLFFSKIGLSVIVLIWLLYQIYKYRLRSGARQGNASYYDHINTYTSGGFERAGQTGTAAPGFFAGIKLWYLEKKRQYHYAKFKKNWDLIQKKYALDMRCPYCGSDITVFNVTGDARCNYCRNRLL